MKTAFLLLTTAWLAGAEADPTPEMVAPPKTVEAPAAPAPAAAAPVVEAPFVEAAPCCEPAHRQSFCARLKEKLTYKPKHKEAPACDCCGSSAPVMSPAPTVLPAAPEKLPVAPEKLPVAPEKLPAGEKEKTEAAPDLKGAPIQSDKDVPF